MRYLLVILLTLLLCITKIKESLSREFYFALETIILKVVTSDVIRFQFPAIHLYRLISRTCTYLLDVASKLKYFNISIYIHFAK